MHNEVLPGLSKARECARHVTMDTTWCVDVIDSVPASKVWKLYPFRC